TEDGGAHWQGFVMVSSNETVKRICIMDSVICWTLSERDICYKDNIFGPYFIQIQYELSDGFFRDFHFTSATKGSAVGITNTSSALYMWTTNGGADWNQDAVLTGNVPGLRGVFFVNDNTGWVVGHSGCIYRTTNNGVSWDSQVSGVTGNLNALYFFDENMGWIVGDDGTILYTENGGTDWTSQNSGTDRDLTTIFFLDSLRGWVGGDSGTVLCTQSGGTAVEEPVEPPGYFNTDYSIGFDPVKRELSVSFFLDKQCQISLDVYNVSGQNLTNLLNSICESGNTVLAFDVSGIIERIPNGLYFVVLKTRDRVYSRQLLLME
ncbi:hypothetical protein JXL83_04940, partial [candidate division WOR-3 bacterium]|nr:hypothetical protein [candidate division WOR-3 bacterium]